MPLDPVRTRQALLAAASSFRLGMHAQGNDAFVHFVDGLRAWIEEPERGADARRLSPLFAEFVAAQMRGDYLRVADMLEYELAPHLG